MSSNAPLARAGDAWSGDGPLARWEDVALVRRAGAAVSDTRPYRATLARRRGELTLTLRRAPVALLPGKDDASALVVLEVVGGFHVGGRRVSLGGGSVLDFATAAEADQFKAAATPTRDDAVLDMRSPAARAYARKPRGIVGRAPQEFHVIPRRASRR